MVTVIVHHLSYITVMEQLPTVIPMLAYRSNCYGYKLVTDFMDSNCYDSKLFKVGKRYFYVGWHQVRMTSTNN